MFSKKVINAKVLSILVILVLCLAHLGYTQICRNSTTQVVTTKKKMGAASLAISTLAITADSAGIIYYLFKDGSACGIASTGTANYTMKYAAVTSCTPELVSFGAHLYFVSTADTATTHIVRVTAASGVFSAQLNMAATPGPVRLSGLYVASATQTFINIRDTSATLIIADLDAAAPSGVPNVLAGNFFKAQLLGIAVDSTKLYTVSYGANAAAVNTYLYSGYARGTLTTADWSMELACAAYPVVCTGAAGAGTAVSVVSGTSWVTYHRAGGASNILVHINTATGALASEPVTVGAPSGTPGHAFTPISGRADSAGSYWFVSYDDAAAPASTGYEILKYTPSTTSPTARGRRILVSGVTQVNSIYIDSANKLYFGAKGTEFVSYEVASDNGLVYEYLKFPSNIAATNTTARYTLTALATKVVFGAAGAAITHTASAVAGAPLARTASADTLYTVNVWDAVPLVVAVEVEFGDAGDSTGESAGDDTSDDTPAEEGAPGVTVVEGAAFTCNANDANITYAIQLYDEYVQSFYSGIEGDVIGAITVNGDNVTFDLSADSDAGTFTEDTTVAAIVRVNYLEPGQTFTAARAGLVVSDRPVSIEVTEASAMSNVVMSLVGVMAILALFAM